MKRSKLKAPLISGIQQIGIGNVSVYDTWEWYRVHLGMDVPVFDEAAEAALMLPYTGGEPRSRHAVLALNLNGGGGAEIWQYTTRVAQPAKFEIQLGDLGFFCAKFKTRDLKTTHSYLSKNNTVSDIQRSPSGQDHFFLFDPFGNAIELVGADSWFSKTKFHTGGVYGMTIGVSTMEKSIAFYKDILGFDKIIYDQTGNFEDLAYFDASDNQFRRVLLTHSKERSGPFSKLLGAAEIELIQSLDRSPKKIFENRMWGDLGYIHLCFDIVGMDLLREKCKNYGCPFTVDSGDFDMGEAAGQFAYIEDPDGALIEFVETHKVPILEKFNWYLDLRKRDANKSLPTWMLKAMGLNRKTKPVN